MKRRYVWVTTILTLTVCMSWDTLINDWIKEDHKRYKFLYTAGDRSNKEAYCRILDTGVNSVNAFFGEELRKEFEVYVHPNRQSLDMQWQKELGMPDFKSECWMVASGMATRIDMISPVRWEEEACEHSYDNKEKTQQLITHELFHVYHAQLNTTSGFSDAVGLDWFIEGFATYASGQLDESRLSEIKAAIDNNSIPSTLDNFWKGKMRYGLSGSVVMYIDNKHGREKLKELLSMNKKDQVLASLGTTESDLLRSWSEFIKSGASQK